MFRQVIGGCSRLAYRPRARLGWGGFSPSSTLRTSRGCSPGGACQRPPAGEALRSSPSLGMLAGWLPTLSRRGRLLSLLAEHEVQGLDMIANGCVADVSDNLQGD